MERLTNKKMQDGVAGSQTSGKMEKRTLIRWTKVRMVQWRGVHLRRSVKTQKDQKKKITLKNEN
jgi:hypothetical protein